MYPNNQQNPGTPESPQQPPVQPQPVFPPQQPPYSQPQTTYGSGAPQGMPPASNGKSKLPFIIGGSILAGLILLGVVGWLLYSMLFQVTKEDYSQAAQTLNSTLDKASASVSDVTSVAYISSYSTQTETKNDIDSAKKSLEEYKSANGDLADLKALRDEDVKKAYDAYMEKYNGYVAFADDYVNSAEPALLAVIECENIGSTSVSDVASYKAALIPCQTALDKAKDVKDKDLSSFIVAYQDNLDEASKLVDEAAKLSAGDYTRMSEIRSQIYDATDALQDAQKDANSNIEKRLEDVNPRDAYNDLADVLSDKQKS